MRVGWIAGALTLLAASSGCLCPVLLRVALPPSPTPTPFVSTFEDDPHFYKQPPPAVIAPLAPQTGTAAYGGRELRMQEPVRVVFKSGAEVGGLLDAMSADGVQVRQGESLSCYPLAEVREITQF